MANNRHLTLDQRIQIEKMLGERSAFSHIARSLDKHPSTISLEVRNHCISEKAGTSRIAYNACIHRYTCTIPKPYLCRTCSSRKRYKLCKHCGMCNAFIRKKQSVHHICVHNADEIMISERTLYRLIGDGHFSFRNIDLPMKVRWRIRVSVK